MTLRSALIALAALAALVWAATSAPTCRPGDRGVYNATGKIAGCGPINTPAEMRGALP